MTDDATTREQPPDTEREPRGRLGCLVMTAVLLGGAFFGLRACYVAQGAYHHDGSPGIEILGAVERDGIPTVGTPIYVRLADTDEARAFIEVLPDREYQIRAKESYVGGWGDHQGSWGGQVFDADEGVIEIPARAVRPGKYWLRSAKFGHDTYGKGDSSFERVIYGLVGKPIDYKGGYYFINENGDSRAYYASRYYPFMVDVAMEPATRPRAAMQTIVAGPASIEVPTSWRVIPAREGAIQRREIEKSVRQFLARYKQDQGSLLGIRAYRSVALPDNAGHVLLYTMAIPPQEDYMATAEKERDRKLEVGKTKGFVKRVIRRGRRKIGDHEVLEVHTVARGGIHAINITHWVPSAPGRVTNLSIAVWKPGFEDLEAPLRAVVDSLRVE